MDNHPYYNRTNFPRRVWHRPDANWDIYADAFGNCASIATKPSCRSTGFGNLAHVAKCKQRDAINRGAKDRRYEQRHKRWQALEDAAWQADKALILSFDPKARFYLSGVDGTPCVEYTPASPYLPYTATVAAYAARIRRFQSMGW